PGAASAGIRGAASSAASRIGDAAGGVGRTASGIGDAAGDAARTVSSGARGLSQRVSHGARYVGEHASRAGQGAYGAGRSSMRYLDEMIQEHPLVMGALAVAIGAAIG